MNGEVASLLPAGLRSDFDFVEIDYLSVYSFVINFFGIEHFVQIFADGGEFNGAYDGKTGDNGFGMPISLFSAVASNVQFPYFRTLAPRQNRQGSISWPIVVMQLIIRSYNRYSLHELLDFVAGLGTKNGTPLIDRTPARKLVHVFRQPEKNLE